MNLQIRSVNGSARLDAEAAEVHVQRQEQPVMEITLSQQRVALAIAASVAGLAVAWLSTVPFGLLAPIVALFVFARGRMASLTYAALAVGLAGALFIAAYQAGAARDLAVTWAAFFAIALCLGPIVAPDASASLRAETMPVAIESAMREEAPSYPDVGPSLREKAAPRHAPFVSVSSHDDRISAALLTAASFWGGTRFHMRYWRRLIDGSHRWSEIRTEPLHELSGTQRWSGVTADIDDEGAEPPTRIAFNPPNNDEAVRAARFTENLLGNAWAFDAAGKPTYLTPLAQTLVAVTLEEFRAAVDEGHTFFKRTAHPDDYDRISAAWRHSLQTGEPFFADRRIRRASGIHEWNRTGFVPTRDGHGRITGWYGATIDLDSHRIAEAELRERERELLQLVNMVPSHLWRLTPDGDPIFFSKRMVDFLGLDVADMDKPGTSRLEALIETIHPDDATEFRDTLRRCLDTGDSFTMRYRLRRADGVHRWMSSRAEPMRDHDGHIAQWYGLCHDIDDQVHAEEKLRQSERRLQQLVDAVPAMIWSAMPDGFPAYVNKRFADVTGTTLEDNTGQDGLPSMRTIHPDDRDEAWQVLARSFEAGTPCLRRYRQLRHDGSYRWTETRVEPLRDESGVVLQWYGVSVDIDDMVKAQEALQQSKQQLQQMIDALPVNILSFDPSRKMTYVSKRYLERVGSPLAHIDNFDTLARDIAHPEDFPEMFRKAQHGFATGQSFVNRFRRRDKDGLYPWIEARAQPLRDANGTILQWYIVSIDIEDEMRAQDALRKSERELSQLVNMVPVYIRRLTPEGEPTFFNKRLTDYIGVDLANIGTSGMSRLAPAVEDFVHPDESAKLLAAVRQSLATGVGYAMKYRMRGADGTYRWIETRAEAIRNQDGTIAQWYAVSIDVDDEMRARQAEVALRETSDKLAKATQAASLAELSASIAHEVNQPLAAIVANSHACHRWLSAAPPNVDRAKITAERIIRDANAAADIVSRIRALFKQSLEPRSSTTFSSIIAETRDLVSEEAARRHVRMDVEVENDLPLVAFDRVQIQQVLINLLRNGMDAMDSGAKDRALRMRVRHIGDVIQTEISDRGPGVKFPDKIFEPFFTTKEQGMGMGLAICRSIIESHGGRLWTEQNEPHGATFAFTLPVEDRGAP
jgi:PAS domain S-box-containing protein